MTSTPATLATLTFTQNELYTFVHGPRPLLHVLAAGLGYRKTGEEGIGSTRHREDFSTPGDTFRAWIWDAPAQQGGAVLVASRSAWDWTAPGAPAPATPANPLPKLTSIYK
jgi:hypothetical protein